MSRAQSDALQAHRDFEIAAPAFRSIDIVGVGEEAITPGSAPPPEARFTTKSSTSEGDALIHVEAATRLR